MKVLWLTSSAAGASDLVNQNAPGRGWIASLGDIMKNFEDIELAVGFFNNTEREFKFSHNHITYYPIKDQLSTMFKKIKSKAFLTMWDSNLPALLKVVNDCKPDIIQIFGTETGLGEIVGNTQIPIVIHLQGLLNPYLLNWLPQGFNTNTILFNSSLKNIILRRDLYSEFLLLKKLTEREESIIKRTNYFFGRTDWDKRIVRLFNNDCEYIHCDEVLRPFFYEAKWEYKCNKTLKLVSTINPQIYKGLDTVLETAHLLKSKSKINFEWTIIGLKANNKVVKLIEKVKGLEFINVSVNFKGIKQGNELMLELLSSNLFIHPSHIDNSPNSVCEAMLIGMPVIAGNVGGVASLIESGHNGILYNSQDSYDLASLILKNAFDTDEMERLGKNARETALKRHDRIQIASMVRKSYFSILNKEKRDS